MTPASFELATFRVSAGRSYQAELEGLVTESDGEVTLPARDATVSWKLRGGLMHEITLSFYYG